ncbi:hypothetical protein MRX96_035865 [Rhipicephalus microplus]
MYFCSLCAYSTCGKAHLAIHAYHEHRDVQPVPWHSKDSILPQPSQSETKYLVRPKEYTCGLCKQQCRFRCLTTVMFREHLEEHHCGSVAYDCHLCLTRASSPGVLLEHYRCDHAYFNVHCLYCDFGKEDDWVVMRHIMEKHPDKPFRLLLRNGDSAAVVQELRKLVEEYLSRDPVPQPFLSGSSQVEPCTPSMQQTADISRKSNNKPTTNLCKHFAEMHENSFRNIDSASTLVSLQGDWKLQGFTSISNTIRNVKFSSSGDAQIERSNRKIALHFKQMKSRYFKASAITDNIFIRVDGVRVPYSQFASVTNLNPVVQLVKLPVMKQEPP